MALALHRYERPLAASPFVHKKRSLIESDTRAMSFIIKPLQAHLGTWIRNDLGVRTFQGLGRSGPLRTQVVRRIARDLHIHQILESLDCDHLAKLALSESAFHFATWLKFPLKVTSADAWGRKRGGEGEIISLGPTPAKKWSNSWNCTLDLDHTKIKQFSNSRRGITPGIGVEPTISAELLGASFRKSGLPQKRGRQKEFFFHRFFCHFGDSFGHFLVTFPDASVTFFVTFLPNSFCRSPFAAG